jgi:hypothetical protein
VQEGGTRLLASCDYVITSYVRVTQSDIYFCLGPLSSPRILELKHVRGYPNIYRSCTRARQNYCIRVLDGAQPGC